MSERPYYDGPSWQAAETEVLWYGVADSQFAVRLARYVGVTPVYVLACVEFFEAHRGTYKPRDLFKRLQHAATYRDPDDPETWPQPKRC